MRSAGGQNEAGDGESGTCDRAPASSRKGEPWLSGSAGGGRPPAAYAAARRMRTIRPRSASGRAAPACCSIASPVAPPGISFVSAEVPRLIEPGAGRRGAPAYRRQGGASSKQPRAGVEQGASARRKPCRRLSCMARTCLASPQLRYHPRTPSGPAPVTRYRPALIAAVRDRRGLVAIHRTFLDSSHVSRFRGGPTPPRTWALWRWRRAARGSRPRLGLAEGIETALSAAVLFGIPCWATLGTERFALVSVPGTVEELLCSLTMIGRPAGRALARRLSPMSADRGSLFAVAGRRLERRPSARARAAGRVSKPLRAPGSLGDLAPPARVRAAGSGKSIEVRPEASHGRHFRPPFLVRL